MKAAILVKKNEPLMVDDVILPQQLFFGQVKIKNIISGLCGAQLQEIAGLKNNEKFMPHLLGHEGCGVVEEIGQGVNKVKVGDKVVLHWRKASGIESEFPIYTWNDRKISGAKFKNMPLDSPRRLPPDAPLRLITFQYMMLTLILSH